MANRERCAGRRADGEACKSPFVGEDGFCDAHSASRGGRDEMRRRGMAGAWASRKSSGLDPNEIETLETHADVRRRLDLICQAVLTGRLRDGQAQAAIRACEAWIRTRGEEVTMEVVGDLRRQVEDLKVQLAKKPAPKIGAWSG